MGIIDTTAQQQNLAINGAMDFFQRIETGTLALGANNSAYGADMFFSQTTGSTAKSVSVAQSTNVPSQAQSGFMSTYSLQATNNTAISTLAAGDFFTHQYRMEGFDYAKIHAKTATFSFWFNTTVAGTYPFALVNSTGTRSYVTTYSAPVGWSFQSFTIPLDTVTASWVFLNNLALLVAMATAAGSTWQTSTLNTWQNGNFISTPTATNWLATSGATINIAQFSIVEGSYAMGGGTNFSRCGKDIQQELAMCQRYYEKTFLLGVAPGVNQGYPGSNYSIAATGPRAVSSWCYQVRKRAIPSFALYSPDSGGVNRWSTNGTTPVMEGVSVTDTQLYAYATIATSNLSSGYSIHMTVDAGL